MGEYMGKEGKDVTAKTIKVKTGKSGKGKGKKEVEEEVSLDSFFNFFSPPVVSDDPNEELAKKTKLLWLLISMLDLPSRKRLFNVQFCISPENFLTKMISKVVQMRTSLKKRIKIRVKNYFLCKLLLN